MRFCFLLLFTVPACWLQAQQARVITTQELLKKYGQAMQKQTLNQPLGRFKRNQRKAVMPDGTTGHNLYKLLPGNDSAILHLLQLSRAYVQPGVYRLRDGMSCIVPDTKNIAAIPNAWPAPQMLPFPSAIPNGGQGLFPVLPQPAPPRELKKDDSR